MVVRAKKFKLLARTRHVLSEARRVLLFRNLVSSTSEDVFPKLGSLMDASQVSCREDFQCSCPELDELCQIAKKHGAYGARLTGTIFSDETDLGAGWGGAIVALTTKEEAQRIVDGLIKEYYHVKFPKISEEELQKTVFATQPGSGALVYVVGENGIQ
jgi:galactokinase